MKKRTKNKENRFKTYGLDLRALSAFRIIVGLNVIYNLIKYRFYRGGIFYIDGGINAPDAVSSFYGYKFSLISLFPSQGFVLFFFGLTFLLALLYTLGVKARWVAPLLLFCFANIITANPWTVHAVEFLIEASLFWSLFLPIDQHYAILPEKKASFFSNELRTLPAFALLIQIFFVYFTSGITKSGEYWREGLTVLSVMDDRMHAGLLADWFAAHPGLCSFLTHSSVYVEVLIGLFIFLPFYSKQLRLLIAIAIPSLHFGLALGMNVGPFHWITLAFAIVILPDFIWDKLSTILGASKPLKKRKKKSKSTILKPAWHVWPIRIFIVSILIGVGLQNLKKWERDSYISSTINAIPPLDQLAEISLPQAPLFTGIWHQPWWTFSPNPHEQMGCLVMFGRRADNTSVDLITGQTVTVNRDPNTSVPIFNIPPRNHFKRTDFVFAWYVRRYVSTMPKPMLEKWLTTIQEEYNLKYPKDQVSETGLFFFSNQTDLVNGQITRQHDFIQVPLQ